MFIQFNVDLFRGDVFSALILAHLDKHSIKKACELAVNTMQNILKKTIKLRGGAGELALIQSLNEIQNPTTELEAVSI